MKQKTIAFLIISLVFFSVLAAQAQEQNGDFLSVSFGMSRAEVISAIDVQDDTAIYDEDDYVAINGVQFGGIVGYVLFHFDEDDACYSALFLSTESHELVADYVDDYAVLTEAATAAYGKPLKTEDIWLDATYKNNPTGRETAILLGHLRVTTTYETETATVTLIMHGADNTMQTLLSVASKEYGKQQPPAA